MNNDDVEVGKIEVIPSVFYTNWCTNCYPVKEYAEFIWHGHSYCESCFAKEKGVDDE